MKLITIRSQIKTVAQRWRDQYFQDEKWSELVTGNSEDIYNKLKSLDPIQATAKEVEAIIGNCSWAGKQQCHECKKYYTRIVSVGEEPDYESSTARLCLRCLRRATSLIMGNKL